MKLLTWMMIVCTTTYFVEGRYNHPQIVSMCQPLLQHKKSSLPNVIHQQQQQQHLQNEWITTTDNSISLKTAQLIRGGSLGFSDNMNKLLYLLEMLGTVVFAFSGAVTAGKVGMDLLGMIVVAIITATGGGTVRDMLLGAGPVFWMRQPIYLHICLLTTVLTFVLWPWLEREWGYKDSDKIICFADAVGLAAFVIVTTEKGNEFNMPSLYWIVVGLISCTFGGIIRDVLCNRPTRVLFPHRTLYATPILLGSTVYTFCKKSNLVNISDDSTAIITFFVTFCTRVWAFDNPIRLPHWQSNKLKNKSCAFQCRVEQ